MSPSPRWNEHLREGTLVCNFPRGLMEHYSFEAVSRWLEGER
ncbi:hypothetical protein [Paramicrobacterium fandaimingii]|nr:hypothetical protein [Microbacterium fandaimingii]